MADSYIDLAIEILQVHQRPMSSREIIDLATKYKMLPPHLHGKTIHKTMQARLSEHIVMHRFKSPFFRVSPGVFYLRSLQNEDGFGVSSLGEYIALRRQKSVRRQKILCVNNSEVSNDCGVINKGDLLPSLLFSPDAIYARKDVSDQMPGYLKVLVFSIVAMNGRFLAYRIGRYSDHMPSSEMTLGIRSFVTEFDIDLLNDDIVGIKRSACRELMRRLEFSIARLSDIEVINNIVNFGWKKESGSRMVFFTIFDVSRFEGNIGVNNRSLGFNKPIWLPAENICSAKIDDMSKFCIDLLGVWRKYNEC